MPTERPTLLPPMFNIMGGKGSGKSENFSKKSQGGKMSKSLKGKTLSGGKKVSEGEGIGYDIKQGMTTGSISKSPKKAPTTIKLKEAQSIYRQSSKTSKPSLMQQLTGGGGKTPLENSRR